MKTFMQKVVIAVFIILCIGFAAFIAIAVFFVYLESSDTSTTDQKFYTRESTSYGIGIYDDSIWKTDIDFEQFEPLADDREFYLNGPETDNPEISLNKYYLDSKQGFYKVSEINDKNYYKELDCLFGTDESHINFILTLKYESEVYDQWYIRKGYHIPSVEKDNVAKLIFIDNYRINEYNNPLYKTKSHPVFKRVEVSGSGKEITDRAVINKCLEQYKKKNYDFSELKNDFNLDGNNEQYFVLAAFENDSLYQCIGYFYN